MTTTPTIGRTTWAQAALTVLAVVGGSRAAEAQARAVSAPEVPRFLVGCWTGVKGDDRFRERWTAVDAGTLLGVGDTVTKGRISAFEYFRIVVKNGVAVYVAQPGGVPPTEFTASAQTDREVTFENLAHDFPKRVSYRRVDATHLLAWIDGGPSSTKRIHFPMQREPCEAQ